MGADQSKAVKFWEIHCEFVLVVLWHTWQGPDKGYYCGYLGYTDPSKTLPHDTYFHWGEAVGGLNTSTIPEIGITVDVSGFDTLHSGDINFGPDGEQGHSLATAHHDENMIWTRERVFQKLRDIADTLKTDENN